MKVGNVILIGAVVLGLVVIAARESMRSSPEQVRSSVTSPGRLPAPAGTERGRGPASSAERPVTINTRSQRTSELPALEESAIADAPQGQEQGGQTQKDQEQAGKNAYGHSPSVPTDVFDKLVRSGSSEVPNPVEPYAQRFFDEEPDPNWSPNVESQLQSSLLNEEATKLFDVVSMGCRKTVCEIRAVAPSKEMNAQSLDALQVRMYAMPKEGWWTGYGLKVPALAVTTAPDGRTIMVAYIATH